MFNAKRMNYQQKNKLWFEVLKWVKVEDEVKCERKKAHKKVFTKDRGKPVQNIHRDGNRKRNV